MAYSQITWPTTLPQAPQRDYSETVNMSDVITTSEFDSGPVRQRRRSTATTEKRTCVYVLTATQRATLKTFLTTNMGRSFWWPDPVDGSERYVRLDSSAGGIEFKPWGDTMLWQATLKIEIWPYVTRSTANV